MRRKRLSERVTDALRGDISALLALALFFAIWVICYSVIDYMLNTFVIITLLISYFAACYLVGLVGKFLPEN